MSLEHNDKIVWEGINNLKTHPSNTNIHTDKQIKQLAKIIKYQGWRSPIVVSNLSGYIVAGHARLSAALELGLSKAPVSYQDFTDTDQEIAYITSDNAIALQAELDMSLINEQAMDLGPDFDIDLLGLEDFEVEPADKYIQNINSSEENEDWVGLPEFEAGEPEYKIIIHFKNDLDREEYAAINNLKKHRMHNGQWIIKL